MSPNTEYVFDLELPLDFVPKNQDGEVSEFQLLTAKVVIMLGDDAVLFYIILTKSIIVGCFANGDVHIFQDYELSCGSRFFNSLRNSYRRDW